MSYLAHAKITEDPYIIMRVKACVSSKGVLNAHEWTMRHIWSIAASPGWAEAYGALLDGEDTTDPAAWGGSIGADPNVITDSMILSAVDSVIAQLNNQEGVNHGKN